MDLIIFLLALSVLVILHELGHFLAAKSVNIKVEEFGLGIPPRVMGKKVGETIWSLNLLPIGGFVRMFGEDTAEHVEKNKEAGRAFWHKKPWQKFIVVVGGVVMNVVTAVLIFTFVYKITGVPIETKSVKVEDVVAGSPADLAGIKKEDVILKVEEKEVSSSRQLIEEVAKHKGKEVELLIGKGSETFKLKVKVRENPPAGEGSMGVAVSNMVMEKIGWGQVYKGVWAGFKEAYFWGKIIGEGVFNMIRDVAMGRKPEDVSGPIGMYQATSNIRQNQGLLAVLHFFGIVSVNLAVVNILPFPALDGGRLMFVLYEAVIRKRPNAKLEAVVNNVGMMILLTLIALVAVGDILRIIRK